MASGVRCGQCRGARPGSPHPFLAIPLQPLILPAHSIAQSSLIGLHSRLPSPTARPSMTFPGHELLLSGAHHPSLDCYPYPGTLCCARSASSAYRTVRLRGPRSRALSGRRFRRFVTRTYAYSGLVNSALAGWGHVGRNDVPVHVVVEVNDVGFAGLNQCR